MGRRHATARVVAAVTNRASASFRCSRADASRLSHRSAGNRSNACESMETPGNCEDGHGAVRPRQHAREVPRQAHTCVASTEAMSCAEGRQQGPPAANDSSRRRASPRRRIAEELETPAGSGPQRGRTTRSGSPGNGPRRRLFAAAEAAADETLMMNCGSPSSGGDRGNQRARSRRAAEPVTSSTRTPPSAPAG